MASKHGFKFDVDLNVINHLGVGLYSSAPAALTELVANAWDADATVVEITISPEDGAIALEDDGHGMTAADISGKFLNVGYSRRRFAKNHNLSDSGSRRVMGRKGIGKLAMFALADFVRVTSQAKGEELIGLEIDVPILKQQLDAKQHLELNEFPGVPFAKGHGTRIELSKIRRRLQTTESYLRIKLARRFSVLGPQYGFQVYLNGTEITRADRGFYEHVQFLWAFDDQTRSNIEHLARNISSVPIDDDQLEKLVLCSILLPSTLEIDADIFNVQGYVASAFKPGNLGSKEDSANMLSVFANGRLFVENILGEVNSAKYFQNYLVGEIHADFLDNDEVDRATASREAVKRDDPRYDALIGFVRTTLSSIDEQWDDWRTSLGLDAKIQSNQAVNDWLGTLTDKRDIVTAKKLMMSIQNATIHSDESKNEHSKKILYRGAIIGFEKLRLKKQLDKLAEISDVLGAEFAAIFASLDDLEESAYADITKQRLEVIRKFKAIANDKNALEKVAQNYLFDHLWLLDPSWDRVTGRAELEQTLTAYLKKRCPESKGARLDIVYRASSGRHIVVELKKPGRTSIPFTDLYDQVRRYKIAVEEYFKEKLPDHPQPAIDIYVLIAKTPSGFNESDRKSLLEQCGRIITYEQLIADACNAYQDYLNAKTSTSDLERILARL